MRPGALEMSDFSDEAVDVEGATRAETAANAVDAVAAAIHSGNGDAGIARLANSVHSGRTGRYGEAFAPVETTLTWGKGLKLEDLAEPGACRFGCTFADRSQCRRDWLFA